MIYAIEAIGLDRVKFGKARNPWDRVKLLATGSPVPLELIIAAPWPDYYEGVIHRAFADERIAGEWFLATKRIERFCHIMDGGGLTDSECFTKSMAFIDNLGPASAKQAPVVSGEEAASAGKPQSAETLAGMRQGPPLTPAEKQRRYRERGGDELREHERLRVAAKRKELRGA